MATPSRNRHIYKLADLPDKRTAKINVCPSHMNRSKDKSTQWAGLPDDIHRRVIAALPRGNAARMGTTSRNASKKVRDMRPDLFVTHTNALKAYGKGKGRFQGQFDQVRARRKAMGPRIYSQIAASDPYLNTARLRSLVNSPHNALVRENLLQASPARLVERVQRLRDLKALANKHGYAGTATFLQGLVNIAAAPPGTVPYNAQSAVVYKFVKNADAKRGLLEVAMLYQLHRMLKMDHSATKLQRTFRKHVKEGGRRRYR